MFVLEKLQLLFSISLSVINNLLFKMKFLTLHANRILEPHVKYLGQPMNVTKLFNTNVLNGWKNLVLWVWDARIHNIVIKTLLIMMVLNTTFHAWISMLENHVLQMMTATEDINAQIGSWAPKPMGNFVLLINVVRNITTQPTKLNII